MKDKQLAATEKLISLQEEANRKLGSIERLLGTLERRGREKVEPEKEEQPEKTVSIMTKSGPMDFGG